MEYWSLAMDLISIIVAGLLIYGVIKVRWFDFKRQPLACMYWCARCPPRQPFCTHTLYTKTCRQRLLINKILCVTRVNLGVVFIMPSPTSTIRDRIPSSILVSTCICCTPRAFLRVVTFPPFVKMDIPSQKDAKWSIYLSNHAFWLWMKLGSKPRTAMLLIYSRFGKW